MEGSLFRGRLFSITHFCCNSQQLHKPHWKESTEMKINGILMLMALMSCSMGLQSFAMQQSSPPEEGSDEKQPELFSIKFWQGVSTHLPKYGIKDLGLVSRGIHQTVLAKTP
jgi:hypothetical protein